MENKNMDFEKSLKRLDEIVEKVEKETLPLEECLKLYEEGKTLISALEKTLKDAEKKIDELAK